MNLHEIEIGGEYVGDDDERRRVTALGYRSDGPSKARALYQCVTYDRLGNVPDSERLAAFARWAVRRVR